MSKVPAWLAEVVSPLDVKLGIDITELSPERAVGSMPVAGNEQPLGLLHGGASGVLVETLASMCAMAYGYPERCGVGVDLNVTHVRAAKTGRVTGTATAIRLGGRVASYAVEVVDDEGLTTAVGRLTCQMIPMSR